MQQRLWVGRGSGATRSDRRTALALVAGQFFLLCALAGLPRRADWPIPVAARRLGHLAVAGGMGIAAIGATSLGRGLTALPLPNEHARLRTGGLYHWVRHPIYSGVLLAAAGRAETSGNRWSLVAFGGLAVLLTGKSRFEERHLAATFPEYSGYAARTGRFVPRSLRP